MMDDLIRNLIAGGLVDRGEDSVITLKFRVASNSVLQNR
jgi:hypothetical protein